MSKIYGFFFYILFSAAFCGAVFAQNGATIRGTVTDATANVALHNVVVSIVQTKQTAQTDESGNYEINGVSAGTYTILAHIEGFSDAVRTINVDGAAAQTVDFKLSLTGLREEVTVSASGAEQTVFDSFQTVNSIGQNRIIERAATSLGEVLEGETGVAKRSFGTGSARPVIRGFDGDRVLIAQDGVRTGSLGSQSADHGEPIDTINVERIEVLKGPATLLYGSNALGGVVNVITSENDYHDDLRGFATAFGGTNGAQAGASGGAEYGWRKFLFRAGGTAQRIGDFSTPLGKIPNSASRSSSFNGGIGYYSTKAFLNFNYSYDVRLFGVPYAALFEAEETADRAAVSERAAVSAELPPTPDEEIDLRMRTHLYRLSGGFRDLNAPVSGISYSLNFSDYRHKEIENNVAGTIFNNDVFSYRTMFEQRAYRKMTGRFGFDGYERSYRTDGAEQLIEGKVRQKNLAAYALEEFNFDRVRFQFGGRVENNRLRAENPELRDRSFTGISGSAGIRFNLWNGGALVANATSAYRAPALEELYNNGAHVGTVTFEIGSQNLKRERANGLDFSLRHLSRRFRFDTDVYFYDIKDFVYLAPLDADGDGEIDVRSGLPTAAYNQKDSRFIGAELNLQGDFNDNFGVFVSADTVSARLKDGDIPLPRITPPRLRTGLEFRLRGLNVRPELVFVGKRGLGDIFITETPTAGYGLFNLNASYSFTRKHSAHIFSVNGFNLNNKLYRNHLSFVKDLVPEFGRGARFSYTLRFF